MSENKIFNLPTNLKCANCGLVMSVAMGITQNSTGVFRKGKPIVCAKCGQANVMSDSGFRLITAEEKQRMNPRTRLALESAEKVILGR